VSIAHGQTIPLQGTTANATDKFMGAAAKGNCGVGNFTGPDLIYAVTPTASGMLTASLDASYANSYVHVRTKCTGNMVSDEIACEYSTTPGTDTTTFAVTSGTTYYVAADSWMNMSGTFTLTLSLN
jgi:hypothetical protein